MRKRVLIIILILIIFLPGCGPKQPDLNIKNISMQLTSPVFEPNEEIPAKYTCDGQNINPPLSIDAVPPNAQSLVLIVDDPDAPAGAWTHWVVWNIDPKVGVITENSVPSGAVQGLNSFKNIVYGGPCPPSGVHHYYFKIYALDKVLELAEGADLKALELAMYNHIIDSTQLIGLYERL